ncbi:hypothetical protein COCOBI_16-4500 [Coccomyxa sp. Obi]|nr:hypothetical protein COCOBI_16-4500 [Coccomyxa sp. Obi]
MEVQSGNMNEADERERLTNAYIDKYCSLGAFAYIGRSLAVKSTLASCSLSKGSRSERFFVGSGCHFELLQKDVMGLQLADGSPASLFLLSCTVSHESGVVKDVALRFLMEECAEYKILGIAKPPAGVQCVHACERDGSIVFERCRAVRGLFPEHNASGIMKCEKRSSKEARVELLPEEGTEEPSCLSGEMLLCIVSPELRFDMFVSARASISAGGLVKKMSAGGLLKSKREFVSVDLAKKVRLSIKNMF